MLLNASRWFSAAHAALLSGVLAPQVAQAQELPSHVAPTPEIASAELRAHVEFLASDELGGRQTASPGSTSAAEYLVRELRALGFQGGGDEGGFLQDIELYRGFCDELPEVSVMDPGGTVRDLEYGSDFRLRIRSAVDAVFEVVAVNSAEEMPSEPRADAALYIGTTRASERQRWMTEAGYPGGAGWGLLMAPRRGKGSARTTPPAETWQQSLEPATRPNEIQVSGKARELFERERVTRVKINLHYRQEHTAAKNVVAILPAAADSELGEEGVVLSAHYDHMGRRELPGGRVLADGPPAAADAPVLDDIYNGADDNASGVAMVLEIAEALALEGPQARTVIVLFGTGEERGLFGSKFYLERPSWPLEQTILDLNFEMVGRPDELSGGSGRLWMTGYERTNLGAAFHEAGLPVSRDQRPNENFFGRSDNIVFAMQGIVAQSLSSYNMHSDYHKVSDEAATIDFDHMQAAARVGLQAIQLVTHGQVTPAWLPGGRP